MDTDPATNRASYTYEDYQDFPDDLRCEIINGEVYDMTPAPSVKHQRVAGEIFRLTGNYLVSKQHPCQSFIAPTDVVLADDQVVQPDVFLVCDEKKIQDKAIFGAPDVVFEVLSTATGKKDRGKKMKLYRRFGVLEYFLVDPENELVEKYVFSQGRIGFMESCEGDETFSIDTIGFKLTAKDLFV
jgi:Uma2 family endonuclease